MNVGKSVKIALATQEKNQGWLADQLEVTKQQASNITNSPKASSQTIDKLSKVFRMSSSDFIALGE